MGSDKEIRQRRSFRSAPAPISKKRLPCKKGGLIGNRLSFEQGFRQRVIEVLNSRIVNRNLGIDNRVDNQTKAITYAFYRRCRPGVPSRVLCQDIEQDVAVDDYGAHYSPRVSAMISSVLMATSPPRARKWATMRAPRLIFFRLAAGTIVTTFPSNSKSTSVWGNRPACSRISAGMVTWPFDVIRMSA